MTTILTLFCIVSVGAMLMLAWGMCRVASSADDVMAIAIEQLKREQGG